MAKKIKRTVSRKQHHSRRRKQSHKHRTVHRRRGGSAPIGYNLSNGWSSKMSSSQGGDYFKYHMGQHGGVAPLSALGGDLISPEMRGPAHVGGIDKAIMDVRGLKDQAGGRRKNRKSRKSHSKKNKKTLRKRGGAQLVGAPFPSQGMLLNSPKYYAQAGLNPEWKTDVAYDLAKIRQGI